MVQGVTPAHKGLAPSRLIPYLRYGKDAHAGHTHYINGIETTVYTNRYVQPSIEIPKKMKEIFESINSLEPLNNKDIKGTITPSKSNIFNTLVELEERNIFPKIYLDFLRKIDDQEHQNILSKKFLNILLFAKSNLTTDKIHDWFLSGFIPRTYFFGINSMSALSSAVEKYESLIEKSENNFDKIDDYKKRLKEKGNKKISESLRKREDSHFQYQNELEEMEREIENVIYQIESKLATGRKL